jgi:hypothetical protein
MAFWVQAGPDISGLKHPACKLNILTPRSEAMGCFVKGDLFGDVGLGDRPGVQSM